MEKIEQGTINDTSQMKLLDIYQAYGYIRYTVQHDHCKMIKVDEVIKSITEEHKKKIKNLFGYDEDTIDFVLHYVKEYSNL